MADYSYEDIYGETKTFDVKDLKELANRLEKHIGKYPDYNIIDGFFSWALFPYYTPCLPNDFYGITKNAGHIIYRLSDFLSEETRKNIHIYPHEKGMVILKQLEGNVRWDSLEDWRKEWKKNNSYIPDFIKRLPSNFKFLEKL
ncbi:Uncharacterised protein [uncultured archaeon]|nr:Uncharacterised protein [uncultured archaeon]